MYENRWNWALSHVYEAVFWSVFPDGFLENFTEVWSMFETFLGQRICSYVGELESLGQGWKHKCPNKEFEEGQKQEEWSRRRFEVMQWFLSFWGKVFNGRDPFNQNSNRSDRENWSTSKGGPVFSKLFRLDRTDPLSFGPKFPEGLV